LHEGLDDGEHRGRLRLVAFKGADHQRKPAGVGEQADGDLRLQAAFLGESRLAEPVAGIGLEVQGADVVKDQAGRAEPGMRRARRRQLLAPGVPGIDPQPPIHRGIGGRGGAGLFQHAGAVQLAGRLDDPRQHQVAEHLVPARRLLQPQNGIAAGQGIPQMPHPRGRDRLRAPGVSIRLQAQIELALPGRQPLPRRGLQQLHPGVVMRRPQMVDLAGTAAGGIHDLHRRGARGRLHRPQIGGHPLTLRPAASRLVRKSQTSRRQTCRSMLQSSRTSVIVIKVGLQVRCRRRRRSLAPRRAAHQRGYQLTVGGMSRRCDGPRQTPSTCLACRLTP